jgi:hypothetical protein
MYGSVDYEIVQEIARIMNKWRDEKMDPLTISRLARIRQQEILEAAARDYEESPTQVLLWRMGNVLVEVGQKMMRAANRVLEEQNCPPQAASENCS